MILPSVPIGYSVYYDGSSRGHNGYTELFDIITILDHLAAGHSSLDEVSQIFEKWQLLAKRANADDDQIWFDPKVTLYRPTTNLNHPRHVSVLRFSKYVAGSMSNMDWALALVTRMAGIKTYYFDAYGDQIQSSEGAGWKVVLGTECFDDFLLSNERYWLDNICGENSSKNCKHTEAYNPSTQTGISCVCSNSGVSAQYDSVSAPLQIEVSCISPEVIGRTYGEAYVAEISERMDRMYTGR